MWDRDRLTRKEIKFHLKQSKGCKTVVDVESLSSRQAMDIYERLSTPVTCLQNLKWVVQKLMCLMFGFGLENKMAMKEAPISDTALQDSVWGYLRELRLLLCAAEPEHDSRKHMLWITSPIIMSDDRKAQITLSCGFLWMCLVGVGRPVSPDKGHRKMGAFRKT